MAKSKQTSMKKEKESRKRLKRKKKEAKREERKSNSNKGKGFDSMIGYVDEFGRLSDTPPDMTRKKEVKAEDMMLGARPLDDTDEKSYRNTGRVSYINEEKGYGFIKDAQTKESVFFSLRNAGIELRLSDMVSFDKMKGEKGLSAARIVKER